MQLPHISVKALGMRTAKVWASGMSVSYTHLDVYKRQITVTIQEATGKASGLSGGVLGAQGLFVGMLVAVLITNLFHWLTSIEKIKIKMPASVPAGIANSFNTVSYTHLDVYKRQEKLRSALPFPAHRSHE